MFGRRSRVGRVSLLGLVVAGSALHAGGGEASTEAARLTLANDLLRKQVELAAGKEFYLLLDPHRPAIRLMLRGVVLQEFPALSVELGRSRTLFIERAVPAAELYQVWTGGQLDPPRALDRLEITVAPSGNNAEPPPDAIIPPTPEQKFPMPPRYFIRYAGGCVLEIQPETHDPEHGLWRRVKAALGGWSADFVTGLPFVHQDTLHLKIVLPADAASRLYRSVPPDTRLLILILAPEAAALTDAG